ncbi:MAG: hypothetical protein ACXVHQ_39395 [Solirubrobacteraceae bacterium]
MIGNGHAGFGRGALEKGRKAPRQRPTSAAINDLIAHWRRRYQGVPGARLVIESQVCEWCEQILVEVVLAARNTSWSDGRLDALLSPTSFSAALLPRHLLHATLQKRLAQKLGPPRTGAKQ